MPLARHSCSAAVAVLRQCVYTDQGRQAMGVVFGQVAVDQVWVCGCACGAPRL
jgi:hypothetical protein